MNQDYVIDTDSIDVPASGGIPAYLKVLEYIFELPRVQRVVVTLDKIEWTRYRRADEPTTPVEIDLESVLPYSVIRSHDVQEVLIDNLPNPIAALGMLFAKVHMDGYSPILFVTGMQSILPRWYSQQTGVVLPPGTLHGHQVLGDSHIDDETLILCAGVSRRASLVDTQMSYKITLPRRAR